MGGFLVGGLMNSSIEKEGEKLFPDRGDNFQSDEAGGDCSYLVGACPVGCPKKTKSQNIGTQLNPVVFIG